MATGGQKVPEGSSASLCMNCPICLEVYNDPRALACLHTFCFECLDSLVIKTEEAGQLKNGIECPLCRTLTKVDKTNLSPKNWASELPSNYALAFVIQTLDETTEKYKVPVCKPCVRKDKRSKAAVFCYMCNEYQCKDCTDIHTNFGFMKGHKLLDLDNHDDQDDTLDFSHLLQCHEHGKPIEFYCTNHSTLCCTTCAIITHKQCENKELQNIDVGIKDKDVKRDMEYMLKKMELLIQVMEQSETSVDDDIQIVENRLKSIRAKVMLRLDEFEREIRDSIQDRKQKLKINNSESRKQSHGLTAALEGSICMLDTVMDKGSRDARFVVMEKLKGQCEVYKATIQRLVAGVESVDIDMRVGESLTAVCDTIDKLGNVDLKSAPVNIYNKTTNFELVNCFQFQRKGGKEIPLITGLGFMRDGRIIMVDYNNKECLIMNDSLVLLKTCELPFKPQSLTVLSTDEILITGNKAIRVYIVDEKNDILSQSTIKTAFSCHSISEIDKDTFAVGCFDSNVPVQIVTREGDIKPVGGEYSDIQYGVDKSQCCYSAGNNCVVLTIRDKHEICLVDMKHKTTTVIQDTDIIKFPGGVVAANGPSGVIYVCNQDTNSIVQLSFDGSFLDSYKLSDMEYPYSIAISQDNSKMLLSNTFKADRKVGLFELKL